MELLDKHFKPQRTRYAAAHVFRARKQRESETVAEYVADLRSLISKCDYKPDQLDHQLTEQLAEGLANELHRKKLIEKLDAAAEDNRKFANAVEIALKLEMLDHDVREAASSSSGPSTVNAAAESRASSSRGRDRGRGGSERSGRGRGDSFRGPRPRREDEREDTREDEDEDESASCARCGADGHDVRDCRIRAYTKCYTCGKPGHIARVCPRRAKEDDEPRSPSPRSKARSKTASSSKIAHVSEPDSAYFERFDFVGGVYETAPASEQSFKFSPADYDCGFADAADNVQSPYASAEQLSIALARIAHLEGELVRLQAKLHIDSTLTVARVAHAECASETSERDDVTCADDDEEQRAVSLLDNCDATSRVDDLSSIEVKTKKKAKTTKRTKKKQSAAKTEAVALESD
jgi:hypothetical protein